MKIIELTGTTDALGALTLEANETEVGYIEKIGFISDGMA